jgi:hypothetical protein
MARNRCPPGVLCLSSGVINTIILVGVLLIGFFLYQAHGVKSNIQYQQPVIVSQEQQPQRNDTNIYVSRGGDDRYTRAPEPLQIFNGGGGGGLGFSTTKMPFNIPTQGFPPQFTTMGNLTTEDGQVLPLYGRRAAYNSDRYNYYTRTDTYNPVPLPIRFGKRDCMEDTGCDEVFNKDEVRISATGKQAKANIFKFDAPKYIP